MRIRIILLLSSIVIDAQNTDNTETNTNTQESNEKSIVNKNAGGGFFPSLSLVGQAGRMSGDTLGNAIMYLPYQHNNAVYALDARGLINSRQDIEGNIGINMGALMTPNLGLRVFGYFDARKIYGAIDAPGNNTYFTGITVGSELQYKYWLFRKMAFLPLPSNEKIVVSDTNLGFASGKISDKLIPALKATPGFEVETGLSIGFSPKNNFQILAGTYCYGDTFSDPDVVGVRLRTQFTHLAGPMELSVGAKIEYDKPNGFRPMVTFGISNANTSESEPTDHSTRILNNFKKPPYRDPDIRTFERPLSEKDIRPDVLAKIVENPTSTSAQRIKTQMDPNIIKAKLGPDHAFTKDIFTKDILHFNQMNGSDFTGNQSFANKTNFGTSSFVSSSLDPENNNSYTSNTLPNKDGVLKNKPINTPNQSNLIKSNPIKSNPLKTTAQPTPAATKIKKSKKKTIEPVYDSTTDNLKADASNTHALKAEQLTTDKTDNIITTNIQSINATSDTVINSQIINTENNIQSAPTVFYGTSSYQAQEDMEPKVSTTVPTFINSNPEEHDQPEEISVANTHTTNKECILPVITNVVKAGETLWENRRTISDLTRTGATILQEGRKLIDAATRSDDENDDSTTNATLNMFKAFSPWDDSQEHDPREHDPREHDHLAAYQAKQDEAKTLAATSHLSSSNSRQSSSELNPAITPAITHTSQINNNPLTPSADMPPAIGASPKRSSVVSFLGIEHRQHRRTSSTGMGDSQMLQSQAISEMGSQSQMGSQSNMSNSQELHKISASHRASLINGVNPGINVTGPSRSASQAGSPSFTPRPKSTDDDAIIPFVSQDATATIQAAAGNQATVSTQPNLTAAQGKAQFDATLDSENDTQATASTIVVGERKERAASSIRSATPKAATSLLETEEVRAQTSAATGPVAPLSPNATDRSNKAIANPDASIPADSQSNEVSSFLAQPPASTFQTASMSTPRNRESTPGVTALGLPTATSIRGSTPGVTALGLPTATSIRGSTPGFKGLPGAQNLTVSSQHRGLSPAQQKALASQTLAAQAEHAQLSASGNSALPPIMPGVMYQAPLTRQASFNYGSVNYGDINPAFGQAFTSRDSTPTSLSRRGSIITPQSHISPQASTSPQAAAASPKSQDQGAQA